MEQPSASSAPASPFSDVFAPMFNPKKPPTPAPPENTIKVTMDGPRLQIIANVDAQGADKLIKAIEAYKALLD